MRIKEFSIRKYGPLTDSGVLRLTDFNLFWGENEDGKTLTLEALIRLLLGKGQKLFSGIERVNEKPDGYVLLETDRGEEHKLPEGGQITELLALSAEEYRNLFVIRNSDLSIARENEFYGDVTERLMGLRSNQIQKIKNQLRILGNLTEGMDTVNTRQSQHLKSRVLLAEGLLKEAGEFLQAARSQGYGVLEEQMLSRQNRFRELEGEIRDLEKARLQEKFQVGQRHLDGILAALEKLDSLKAFTDEEFAEWQQLEAFIEDREFEREQVQQQLQLQDAERKEEARRLEDYKSQLQISEKRKTGIDELLKPLFRRRSEINELFARRNAGRNFWRAGLLIFLLISLSFLLGLSRFPRVYMLLSAIAAGTITFGLAVFYYFRFIKLSGELKQLEQNLLNRAADLGVPGSDISQIQEQIQRFEENLQRQQQRVAASEGRLAFLENSCKAMREERLGQIDHRVKEARQGIRVVQARHNLESLEIYREKVWQRREQEQKIKESMATLKSLFGMKGEAVAEWIQHWQAEIQDLKEYQAVAPNLQFNEKTLEKKKAEQQQIKEEVERMQRQTREVRERLADFERRAREATLPGEDEMLPCRTLPDLERLMEDLQQFLNEVGARQRTARAAVEIFEEVEREERQKVSVLFGEKSNVSRMFKEITEGLYPAVSYESHAAGIRIKRRDGKVLPAAWLSSGAYDQLYFVVRLALAEKLLRNEKGFFILDDPFLKSDRQRLKRQLEVLLEFARRGWQIIYFSAKEEVQTVLQKYIDMNQVNVQTVPAVDFKTR